MFGLLAPAAIASPPQNDAPAQTKPDDLPNPLEDQRRALRAEALETNLRGKSAENVGKNVARVAKGQYVELAREGEDTILTVLGEFSDFPHNSISEPDRSVNNTTIWTEDFSREYYENLLFSEAPGDISMRNFYIELSSNRYTVNGTVTDWIDNPGTATYYDDDNGTGVWNFVDDSVDGWYDSMVAAGMTADEINDYMAQFDVWDRYDHDGDGNFDEADGYIDHFQSVHPGEGEEAGGGDLGGAAIWSHRWYVQLTGIGSGGPQLDDGTVVPFGGTQIGDSKYWIGDYTIEPENGGVGVFAHEFGHDLGLPDLYDTSGGENSTGFWTLMSSGSWLNNGTDDIGSIPGHMGAWEKFQLGWLNYDVAFAGSNSAHKLGPAEANTKQAQTLFVVLPDKAVESQIATPYSGEYFYYSGADDNLDNTMSKAVTLTAGSSLTAKANVQIEVDWDYAYLVVSTDGGATWEEVATNLSTDTNPNGQNFGHGITGTSAGWVDLVADLSAYTGDVLIGFRYWTDGAAIEPGFMVDDISITGYPLDDAEADAGWTFDGFRLTTGQESGFYFNAYVAENRQYRGYDEGLETGVYNFGFLDNPLLGDYVEHFPYQDGLLISYWDASQRNNNTRTHPGAGLILPIDAHPGTMYRPDGGIWRNRVQSYDSTFSLDPTDAITLHWRSAESYQPSLPGVAVFNDDLQFWDPANPTGGVVHPHTGTSIRIVGTSVQGQFMQVRVSRN